MSLVPSQLPHRAWLTTYSQSGEDSDGNPTYAPADVISERPARYYRERSTEAKWMRDGVHVEGMVAMDWMDGDSIPEDGEIRLTGGQFGSEQVRFDVVHAEAQEMWFAPSHWEIVVGKVR